VGEVQTQLAAAAALGDDSTRAIADALITAAAPAMRLGLLSAIAAAGDEITAALLDSPGAPLIAVRLDGKDVRIEVALSPPDAPAAGQAVDSPDDPDSTARISLRLPEALKAQVEAEARRSGVSVNTWIVRATATAVSAPERRPGRGPVRESGTGQRLTGWIRG
jgi:hypothetical protein